MIEIDYDNDNDHDNEHELRVSIERLICTLLPTENPKGPDRRGRDVSVGAKHRSRKPYSSKFSRIAACMKY